MLNIQEPISNEPQQGFVNKPIWQLAFRSFFLAAAFVGAMAMTIWLLHLQGFSLLSENTIPSLIWHIHEMLFGFAATVAVGFVLTAVQTWTGQPSIKGFPVIFLLSIWAVVRVCLYINSPLSVLLTIFLQVIWWGFAIYTFSRIVLSAQNRRNYIFMPLLSMMALVNIAILVSANYGQVNIALLFSRTGVLLFTVLMTIVGGRVIPFFTVRGANTESIQPNQYIENWIVPISVLAILAFLTADMVQRPIIPAVLFLLVGVLHLIRLSGWRSFETIKVPLLWSLHISYWFMGLGLIAVGLSYTTSLVSFSNALHLITVSAIGFMILAMMSRVSLGHTGRPLKVKPQIIIAFLLFIAAAAFRFLLPTLGLVQLGWVLSASSWILGCGIFFTTYWPVLTAPKQNL